MEVRVLLLAAEPSRTLPGTGSGGSSGREAPLRTLTVPVGEAELQLAETEPPCAAAAAAAAAAWMSLREAFPLFFLSRAYSHFNVKSMQC